MRNAWTWYLIFRGDQLRAAYATWSSTTTGTSLTPILSRYFCFCLLAIFSTRRYVERYEQKSPIRLSKNWGSDTIWIRAGPTMGTDAARPSAININVKDFRTIQACYLWSYQGPCDLACPDSIGGRYPASLNVGWLTLPFLLVVMRQMSWRVSERHNNHRITTFK